MHRLGLDLGADADLLPPVGDDNRDGYWENRRFVEINEAILTHFGGSWHHPPAFPDGWLQLSEIQDLRQKAKALIAKFPDDRTWGWKDPRTSVTLPFWLSLIPELRLILCLRHPLEVAQSLSIRTQEYVSAEDTVALWVRYYEALAPLLPEPNVLVTHYGSHFYDAKGELRRIAEFLDLPYTEADLLRAAETVDPKLYRGYIPDDPDLIRLITDQTGNVYQTLCKRAGPVFEAQRDDEQYQLQMRAEVLRKALSRVRRLEEASAARQLEIERLKATAAEMEQSLYRYRIPKSILLGPRNARREAYQRLLAEARSAIRRIRGAEGTANPSRVTTL